jgi:hypothetical protein
MQLYLGKFFPQFTLCLSTTSDGAAHLGAPVDEAKQQSLTREPEVRAFPGLELSRLY